MHINAGEISKIIKEQIQNYEQRVDATETGTVLSVGDGIAVYMACRTPCPWSFSSSPADCWAWCSTWKKTTWV